MKLFKSSVHYYIALFAIAVALLVINGNFFNLIHNSLQLRKLNKKSEQLDQDYEKLNNEYNAILKGDNSYIEDTARTKYHMAHPDEIEFRLVK